VSVRDSPEFERDRDPPEWEVWAFALAWFTLALGAAVYAPGPLWKITSTVAFLSLGVITITGTRED
jgi:hypothetical protein